MITKRNKYVKSIIVLTGIIVLALISGFTGCGSPTTQTTPAQTSDAGLSGTITESGSTTVQPLAEKWAGAFQKMHPKVTVTIQGGGSGVGVKSAAAGTVDIGAASREITPEDPPVVKHLLCKDAITIIVSPANKLTDISKQQIIDIFSGKITNWSQLGGENKEIHVVAREEGSGTRGAFEEMVMGKTLIAKTAILQNSNGAIKTTVAGDAHSIAFLSLGYLDNSVKALPIGGVAATPANAQAGTYPVVRPLYFLTKAQPTGLVKAFLDYCTGPEGQKIVVEEGYLPIK